MTSILPRVLVVDDEFHIRMLISAVVKFPPATVVGGAAAGGEVVESDSALRSAFMILDINVLPKSGDEERREIVRQFLHRFSVCLARWWLL